MVTQGVGRETVRRAVARPTSDELLEPVRRRGTVVRARAARTPISRSRLVLPRRTRLSRYRYDVDRTGGLRMGESR